MVNKARARGTAAETALVRHLKGLGFDADRQPLQGAFDKGDIRWLPWLTTEVKNCRTPRYGEWLREAEAERSNAGTTTGVVIHKPHGTGLGSVGEWHVVMTMDTFIALVGRIEGGQGQDS